MLDVEENKTVDIDTSGPDTEIELEETQTSETETPEVETSTSETEETSTVVEAKEEKKEEPTKDDKEKELEKYSDGVQRRIAKLTHKWREAERQKDEALTYAKSVLTEKQKAEQKLSKMEPSLLKTTEDSIKSGLESAKAKLAAAREAGDITAEVEAQTAISELAYKQARFNESKVELEDRAKRKEIEVC